MSNACQNPQPGDRVVAFVNDRMVERTVMGLTPDAPVLLQYVLFKPPAPPTTRWTTLRGWRYWCARNIAHEVYL